MSEQVTVQPWTSYFTCLCLRFLIGKMGLITEPKISCGIKGLNEMIQCPAYHEHSINVCSNYFTALGWDRDPSVLFGPILFLPYLALAPNLFSEPLHHWFPCLHSWLPSPRRASLWPWTQPNKVTLHSLVPLLFYSPNENLVVSYFISLVLCLLLVSRLMTANWSNTHVPKVTLSKILMNKLS